MMKNISLLATAIALNLVTNKEALATTQCALEIPIPVVDETLATEIKVKCHSADAKANIYTDNPAQKISIFAKNKWQAKTDYWPAWPACTELRKMRIHGEIPDEISIYAEIKDPDGNTICKTNKVTLTKSTELTTYQQRINEALTAKQKITHETVTESTEQYIPIANVQTVLQKPPKTWLKIEAFATLSTVLWGLGTKLKGDDKIHDA